MIGNILLAFLLLFVGLAHSFSWDIVVGEEKRLNFFYNEKLVHTEDISPAHYFTTSVIYDPVKNRVLFADYNHPNISISSFDVTTRKIQHLVTRKQSNFFVIIAYDPVTQLLFWKEEESKIYSYSLKTTSSKKEVDEKPLFTLNHDCNDIAVDSCGGYIYWITDFEIERAKFDGTEREVLIDGPVFNRQSLAVDQQTQKIYWIEKTDDYNQLTIESADLNGNNRKTVYVIQNETYANSLAVSKDFIYWRRGTQERIFQLPKKQHFSQHDETAKPFLISQGNCLKHCKLVATNYKIKEQTQGIQKCKALKSLMKHDSVPECTEVIPRCVHGTEVSGESRCECAQGYTGARCDVSICHNYCLQGDCSLSSQGQPECSCKAGYSGQRCEIDPCQKHCLNDGVCSLSETAEPSCRCRAGYEGDRCEYPAVVVKCIQTVSVLRDMLDADIPPLSLSKGEKTCA